MSFDNKSRVGNISTSSGRYSSGVTPLVEERFNDSFLTSDDEAVRDMSLDQESTFAIQQDQENVASLQVDQETTFSITPQLQSVEMFTNERFGHSNILRTQGVGSVKYADTIDSDILGRFSVGKKIQTSSSSEDVIGGSIEKQTSIMPDYYGRLTHVSFWREFNTTDQDERLPFMDKSGNFEGLQDFTVELPWNKLFGGIDTTPTTDVGDGLEILTTGTKLNEGVIRQKYVAIPNTTFPIHFKHVYDNTSTTKTKKVYLAPTYIPVIARFDPDNYYGIQDLSFQHGSESSNTVRCGLSVFPQPDPTVLSVQDIAEIKSPEKNEKTSGAFYKAYRTVYVRKIEIKLAGWSDYKDVISGQIPWSDVNEGYSVSVSNTRVWTYNTSINDLLFGYYGKYATVSIRATKKNVSGTVKVTFAKCKKLNQTGQSTKRSKLWEREYRDTFYWNTPEIRNVAKPIPIRAEFQKITEGDIVRDVRSNRLEFSAGNQICKTVNVGESFYLDGETILGYLEVAYNRELKLFAEVSVSGLTHNSKLIQKSTDHQMTIGGGIAIGAVKKLYVQYKSKITNEDGNEIAGTTVIEPISITDGIVHFSDSENTEIHKHRLSDDWSYTDIIDISDVGSFGLTRIDVDGVPSMIPSIRTDKILIPDNVDRWESVILKQEDSVKIIEVSKISVSKNQISLSILLSVNDDDKRLYITAFRYKSSNGGRLLHDEKLKDEWHCLVFDSNDISISNIKSTDTTNPDVLMKNTKSMVSTKFDNSIVSYGTNNKDIRVRYKIGDNNTFIDLPVDHVNCSLDYGYGANPIVNAIYPHSVASYHDVANYEVNTINFPVIIPSPNTPPPSPFVSMNSGINNVDTEIFLDLMYSGSSYAYSGFETKRDSGSSLYPTSHTMMITHTPIVEEDFSYKVLPPIVRHQYGIEDLDTIETGMKSFSMGDLNYVWDRDGVYKKAVVNLGKGDVLLNMDSEEIKVFGNLISVIKDSTAFFQMVQKDVFDYMFSIPSKMLSQIIRIGNTLVFTASDGIYFLAGGNVHRAIKFSQIANYSIASNIDGDSFVIYVSFNNQTYEEKFYRINTALDISEIRNTGNSLKGLFFIRQDNKAAEFKAYDISGTSIEFNLATASSGRYITRNVNLPSSDKARILKRIDLRLSGTGNCVVKVYSGNHIVEISEAVNGPKIYREYIDDIDFDYSYMEVSITGTVVVDGITGLFEYAEVV